MKKFICLFDYSMPHYFIEEKIKNNLNINNYEFVLLTWDYQYIAKNNSSHYDIVNYFYDMIYSLLTDKNEPIILYGNGYGAKILLDLKHRFNVIAQIYHNLFMSLNYNNPYLDANATYKYKLNLIPDRLNKEIDINKYKISFNEYLTWLNEHHIAIDIILANLSNILLLKKWKKYEKIQLFNEKNLYLFFSQYDKLISYHDTKSYIKKLNKNFVKLHNVYYIDKENLYKHWPVLENIDIFVNEIKMILEELN